MKCDELKAINAYQLTINTEDSDVYIHNDEFGCGGVLVECYLKSEADKVIAELEMKLAAAQQVFRLNQPEALYSDLETMSRLSHEISVVERRECHQKYRRCLAMADYCYTNVHCIMGHRLCAFADWKKEWFERWHKRWLELANKFKEVSK